MPTVEATSNATAIIPPKPSASLWDKIQQFFQKVASYHDSVSGYETAGATSTTDPATAHMHWGIRLAEQNKLDEAIEKFEQAAILNPSQAEIYCNWGVSLAKQKRLPEAAEQLKKAVELDPQRAAYQVLLGATLVEQGAFEAGAVYYQQAIALKPNHTEPWLNWAIALARASQFDLAIEKLAMVLQKQATHSQAFYLWGAILAEQHQYTAAKVKFLDCLKFQANHAEATYLLALCHNRLGEFEAGLVVIEKALALQDQKAECYLTKGDCLANLRRYDEAMTYYDLALALNPKLPDVYLSLGQVHCQQANHEAGFTCFERANQLNPQLAGLHRLWGLNLLEQHNPSAALKHLQKAVQQQPQDPMPATWMGLLVAQIRLGLLEDAQQTAVKALTRFPENAGLWHAKGCLLAKPAADLAETMLCFQEAITYDANFLPAQINQAVCHLQATETTEAVRALRALYRTHQATSPLVVTFYGLALLASGDFTEAEVKFKQALALDAGYTKAMAGLLMIYVTKNVQTDALQQFLAQIDDAQLRTTPTPLPCWLWAEVLVHGQLATQVGSATHGQLAQQAWEQVQHAQPWLQSVNFEDRLTITPWRLWLLEA